MSNNENESLAWSLYWSADRLHSCIATESEADQKVLADIWAEYATSLAGTSTVLDLATGNGAVPVAMLKAQPGLKITAVDRAEIDPTSYLSDRPELQNVTFKGSTDINQLEFQEERFAGITSQFGIEYAGLVAASSKALSLLTEGGSFAFVIHHADSEIIKASSLKQAEMSNLLAADGLIDMLHRVLRGEAEFASLEELGQQYIASNEIKTEAISGQIFNGIEQIATLMVNDPGRARNLGATLKLRLQAEHDRLQQMLAAAQSEPQIVEYCTQLKHLGFTIADQSPIYVDHEPQPYLLAWLVKGHLS